MYVMILQHQLAPHGINDLKHNQIQINQKLDSAQCWITVSSVHVSLCNYIHMTRIYSEEKVTSVSFLWPESRGCHL